MVMARRAQKGMTMAGILIAVVVFSAMVTVLAQIAAQARLTDAIELQGQRLANIANAVLRYQSSAENPRAPPPLLPPTQT
jgi:Tfp pilus assembly protein PilV